VDPTHSPIERILWTGCGSHSLSYRKNTVDSLAGDKTIVVWSWPTNQLYCRGKKRGAVPLLALTSLWYGAQ